MQTRADSNEAWMHRRRFLTLTTAFLAASDTRNYLGPLGDLMVTGPTGTNVADLVILLAGSPSVRGL